MSTHSPKDSLWSIADAAEYLGCSTDTIRRMISRGELKAYRYAQRLIRIDPHEVESKRQPVISVAALDAPHGSAEVA